MHKMTMNSIYSKLRSKNIKNYYLLIFCTILSVSLVTSFAVMFFSPTVQKILPVGGDSRKQVYLVFGIAITACVAFTTYASSLFFKYKSRETGILLSLGAKKNKLKKVFFFELSLITFISSLIGLLLSIPISFSIWKLFQMLIIDTKEMQYHIGWFGLIVGIIFCLFVTLCIFSMGVRFLKRTNIIDIINEHRKTEVIKDVKHWYKVVGIILIITGLILGYGVPLISIRYFSYHMPKIWDITFLLSVLGIYMFTTYVVIYNKKGKNSRKYYKNIIPKSMMKFIGKQTVKNMCTISLLIGGALFAAFYSPMAVSSVFYSIKHNPVDYAFYYKASENQIKKDEIYSLAKEYKVDITSYNEVKSISLIVNGINESWQDNGKITFTPIKKIGYSEFFSESDFNKVSENKVSLRPNEYLTIIETNSAETAHKKFNELNTITNPVTDISERVKYKGTIIFQPFVKKDTTKYVISDEDYQRFIENLPIENFENFVLFNVKNPDKTYDFANKLKNEIIKRSSDDVAVDTSYDEYKNKLVEKEEHKQNYKKQQHVELSSSNTQLFLNWKYYPSFTVLDHQDILKNIAVFLMLFIFISIICLIAVAIVSYIRSITIATNNKLLFDDLKRLGARNNYIERCIKIQLKKIFTIPTILGASAIYLLNILILYGNDGGRITESESISLGINLIITLSVFLFMYIIYRISFRKVKKILGI
ncbi:FtsX-like permease family protein [Clostridium cavendishii DSM 21758]|uniref:FtsX-like permease family protein n=1 Tax=Clostridium cavendishii DSM 21758 TaxID=1121302 RepID=A0A1M6MJF1_9CLOT|nr:ABC transporter permease [Clostridium cavendishii]SHJ83413.1 FtsX-like permease family protein [Clostridium cavendishii DSM 21758]